MSLPAVYTCNQDLGIFQRQLSLSISSLVNMNSSGRLIIGKYTVLNLSQDPQFPGTGSFKTGFYCVSLTMNELRFHIALRSPLNCPNFKREIKVLNLLKGVHGISQPLLIETKYDHEWLISDLANQGDLISWLGANPLVINGAAANLIGYQIACAIEEGHKRGVIFRDLKPDNILVKKLSNNTFEAELIDFGYSFIMDEDSKGEVFHICGTIDYMPPEVCSAILARKPICFADYNTDLWSFACILYYLAQKDLIAEWHPGSKRLMLIPQKLYCSGSIYDEVIRAVIYPKNKRPSMARALAKVKNIFQSTYPLGPPISQSPIRRVPPFWKTERFISQCPLRVKELILSFLTPATC